LTVPIDSYIDWSSPSISPTDINGCAPDKDTARAPADSTHASQYTFTKDDDESQVNNGDKGNDDDKDEYNDKTGDKDDEYNDDDYEDEYNDETGDKDDKYANENKDEADVDAGGFDDLHTHAADTILN
jgi:hypothetical protein